MIMTMGKLQPKKSNNLFKNTLARAQDKYDGTVAEAIFLIKCWAKMLVSVSCSATVLTYKLQKL